MQSLETAYIESLFKAVESESGKERTAPKHELAARCEQIVILLYVASHTRIG